MTRKKPDVTFGYVEKKKLNTETHLLCIKADLFYLLASGSGAVIVMRAHAFNIDSELTMPHVG